MSVFRVSVLITLVGESNLPTLRGATPSFACYNVGGRVYNKLMNDKTKCYHCEIFPATALALLTNGNVMRVCPACSGILGKFITTLSAL
jgi:hypothetical protein